MPAVEAVEGGVLRHQGAEIGEAFEQVGAVGDGAQGLPQEDGLDDLGKAQGGDGQIVALQPQHRQPDEESEGGGQQAGQHQGRRHGQAEAHGAVVVLVDLLLGLQRDGKDGVGIGPDEHKARLSQREQAGKAVEQVHGDSHQGIDGAFPQHGEEHMPAGQGQVQEIEHGDADHGGGDGDPNLFLFFHGVHLKPYRWPSHRTVRWAWR